MQALRRIANPGAARSLRPFALRGQARFASGGIPAQAWNQPRTQVTTLSNGIRVASQYTPDETATVGVWIDSGSRYETKETNGAAHFLEHMAFKGTAKRSRIQLETEIENMGGHLNAYTSREQTVYYAKVVKQDLKRGLDVLSDILLNSKMDNKDIELEKGVILREMEEVEKSTEEVVFDRLHQTAFRDSSLGFTILGPVENIQNMKREHLVDYINKNYTANRMVIAAAGNIEHKDLVKHAEEYFAKVPVATKAHARAPEVKPYFCGSELLYRNDEMGPIAHIAVAFEGVPWRSPDAVTMMVMQSLVGTYKKDDSIIPDKISANRTINAVANRMGVGCAENFSAFNTCYSDTGLFGFYVSCDEIAVDHAVSEMMYGNIQMAYSTTEEEVHRAKLQLKLNMFGALDNTTAIAEDIGRQTLVYGRRIPMAEMCKRIDAVDADEVKRVAWKYLHDSEIAITGLGPLHGMPSLLDMRWKTFWYRY